MRKIKILIMSLLVLSFYACDTDDNINTIYDNINGQTGIGFAATNFSAAVRTTGTTIILPVEVTTLSSTARNFNVTVDASSVGPSSDHTIGSITIPADSYSGTLEVSFVDDNLAEGVSYTLVLNLDLSGGIAGVGAKTATINYNKYLICNDLELVLNTDFYASETSWEITDSTGAVVQSDGPFADGVATYNWAFNLPDGCYTFTIFDAFGDGLFDGATTGNWTLSCSIITHSTGSGNFGGSNSTDFCVNP
jgi:hypothetical protein